MRQLPRYVFQQTGFLVSQSEIHCGIIWAILYWVIVLISSSTAQVPVEGAARENRSRETR